VISFSFLGTQFFGEMARRAMEARAKFKDKLLEKGKIFALKTEALSKDKYLSRRGHETLGVVSNFLRSSVRAIIDPDKDGFTFRIGTDVKYGAIHEFGGPVRARNGRVWQMPRRSFLRRPTEETLPEFKDQVTEILGDIQKDLFGGI